jgi:glucose-6-phosphate-specific signal transduction histidine kinase
MHVSRFRPGSVGVGIEGMRQRVAELGGKLRLENTNPGTLVEIILPDEQEKRDISGLRYQAELM